MDPDLCVHDWREEPNVTYTSNPPQKKDVCAICGKWRFRTVGEYVHIEPASRDPRDWPKAPAK